MARSYDHHIVDFSGCSYPMEMQLALQLYLKLPVFYGRNLDALWDCLTGCIGPCEITVRGIKNRPKTVGDYANKILEVFTEAEAEYPNHIKVIVES